MYFFQIEKSTCYLLFRFSRSRVKSLKSPNKVTLFQMHIFSRAVSKKVNREDKFVAIASLVVKHFIERFESRIRLFLHYSRQVDIHLGHGSSGKSYSSEFTAFPKRPRPPRSRGVTA